MHYHKATPHFSYTKFEASVGMEDEEVEVWYTHRNTALVLNNTFILLTDTLLCQTDTLLCRTDTLMLLTNTLLCFEQEYRIEKMIK